MIWGGRLGTQGPSLQRESASKYCISDSFVDYEGYSISSKGFLPTVVDIMVISVKFTHNPLGPSRVPHALWVSLYLFCGPLRGRGDFLLLPHAILRL